ncbi:Gfo/Idh/MocA family oxidoreductase [Myxococcota bacterium]|nr:Gfo/Idh/MocA family oxidoreductase [Myxococcota bacterium]MBU1534258.1 Gfo/Idh/MocA family oxidoreductase [Myxococcota bacterium]
MNSKYRVLIIGYGSIGQRHARLLIESGAQVSIVSRRKLELPNVFHNIEIALSKSNPSHIIISTETSAHIEAMRTIRDTSFQGSILVEKPLFASTPPDLPVINNCYVAYNLRFHPLVQRMKQILQTEQVISVSAYVGQYLPSWRPQTDYRTCYSAKRDCGGGVLRDLSHELDYLSFLFGPWNSLVAHGGKFSSLEIDSDDLFSITYETQIVKSINVHLNYLDRFPQRYLCVNTTTSTFHVDFISGSIRENEHSIAVDVHRDFTYREQLKAFLSSDSKNLCTINEGLEVMKMIEAAEFSSKKKVWVTNG